jgi:hypothetical protein
MATGKGVIQGDTGVAVVDEKHQIIVAAQAHGVGQEQELLLPVVEAVQSIRAEATVITAEAGYQSEANLQPLAEQGIAAYLPDTGDRQRAPRYAGQDKYRSHPAPSTTRGLSPHRHACSAPGLPPRCGSLTLYLPGWRTALP